MTTVPTNLASSMDAADSRSRLDAVAKKLIKHRVILAEILKECVEEFKEFDVKFIEGNCFAGEVLVNEISVDQDTLDADSSIIGADTEDNSDSEGLVRYDLVFDAIVPTTKKIIRLVINIEIQADTNLSYDVVTRAVYYTARLISRQKGTVFHNSHYEQIQKVYSIWICPDPKRENVNSIVEYGYTPIKMIGRAERPVECYDKSRIIVISLNDEGMENRSDIIRLLSTLLSTTEAVDKRKQILETEFKIPMTKEIEEEVLAMCNLGQAVQMSGVQIGVESTRLESIQNLMETMKWSAQQAMDALKVPKDEQARYAAKLNSEN